MQCSIKKYKTKLQNCEYKLRVTKKRGSKGPKRKDSCRKRLDE